MSLFLPFNYRPSSTVVRGGSYTIPADKYAFVYDNSGDSTIDGVGSSSPIQTIRHTYTRIYSNTVIISSNSSLSRRVIGMIDVRDGLSSDSGKLYINNGASFLDLPKISRGSNINILLPKGTTLEYSPSSSGSGLIAALDIFVEDHNKSNEWTPVPSGTVLSGTNYTVVEYDIP